MFEVKNKINKNIFVLFYITIFYSLIVQEEEKYKHNFFIENFCKRLNDFQYIYLHL
jgi:hypothetical protein